MSDAEGSFEAFCHQLERVQVWNNKKTRSYGSETIKVSTHLEEKHVHYCIPM